MWSQTRALENFIVEVLIICGQKSLINFSDRQDFNHEYLYRAKAVSETTRSSIISTMPLSSAPAVQDLE